MTGAGYTSTRVALWAGAIAASLAGVSPPAWSAASTRFQITALSSPPDKVSGGDVLIRVDAPASAVLKKVRVKLNRHDVTSSLHRDTSNRSLTGLVTGLGPGSNVLEVFAGSGSRAADQLVLINYPITGPIFSGPQEQPFICQTQNFKLPDGKFLGPPLDANCSAKTVVNYIYKPELGSARTGTTPGGAFFKPLPSLSSVPADAAWTTTVTGQRVPYVVRVETGTINRAIYQIAILHNPAGEPAPDPLAPPKAWNGRLVYTFGGGCTGGWYRQGISIGLSSEFVTDNIVGKGYAQASSTLNVFGNNCQDVTAAETMMMVKERFIKAYGKPVFTMGRGGSGGAYQQIQIADNYPGLLDGILPSLTFPDVLETTQMLTDARLLLRYFTSPAGRELTEMQRRGIAGVGELKNLDASAPQGGRIDPTAFCPTALPQLLRYQPATNPGGARCDIFDHAVNVYGRDPVTGFARRPVDNVGVQYGLDALNRGVITPGEFLDLNQSIGGYDNDGNIVARRAVGDPAALRAAYRTGRVTNGGGGLSQTPIIDFRAYNDLSANGDIHLAYHSFSLRERLRKANGTAANEVLLMGPSTSSFRAIEEYAMAKLDEWLTSLGRDSSNDRAFEKVVRSKPVDLMDSCYTSAGERIAEQQAPNSGQCGALYPAFPSPRMAAGGPASNDVLKCQLKPIDLSDYRAAFSEAERVRLAAIFPAGVCDWSKPGVEQQPLAGVWHSF